MTQAKHQRILAIAPSTRGFGFAVLEGPSKLVDWGVKLAGRNKNADSLAKVDALMAYYLPTVLVLENYAMPDVRRSTRIQNLGTRTATLAKRRKVKFKLLTRTKVRRVLLGADAPGTKQAIAEFLAKRFPRELGSRLPPKRRPWMSEDYRMGIFDAVALALAASHRNLMNFDPGLRIPLSRKPPGASPTC